MKVEKMEIEAVKGGGCIKCIGYNNHHYYYFDSLKEAKNIFYLFKRDQGLIEKMLSSRKRLRKKLISSTTLSMEGELDYLNTQIHIIDERIKLIRSKKYV